MQSKSHPCRASFLKRGGQVCAFVLSGAHAKDGLYLLWACGHGPIGLAKPYLIFYPLHRGRPKITLVKIMKKDISIKVVTKSVILDKIEWWKRVHVVDPN